MRWKSARLAFMSQPTPLPEQSPFERFKRLAAQVVSVPKAKADQEAERIERERARKREHKTG
jgi:hypothetical protein